MSSISMEELNIESDELTGILNHLQTKDHEEVLDAIDQLRSEGISRYVDLPQLIVCGDQSSGKSSVLEAISGLNFPSKENLCTRFATELILRRAPATSIKISIHPDPDRPEKEQIRLRNFQAPGVLEQFAEIVSNAGKVMGVGEEHRPFCKDILRVEVTGPKQPHLTLVDLPGLYHAPDEDQNVIGIEFVESLVRSYMDNQRSVILAVISAKNEIALQKVTALAREIDPEGSRTLGIITKPDTLPEGSELQRSFYQLAQNQKFHFRLGWHVVKNRTFEELGCSLEERNESETIFLSKGLWGLLPRSQVGVTRLIPRLSNILKDHVLSQLPGFVTETQESFKNAKSALQKMGDPRQSVTEQRRYLLHGSERFSTLVNNSLNGVYLDPYFGDSLDESGYEKRLRAVVQNRLSHFAEMMRDRGEYRKIIDEGAELDQRRLSVYRTEFVEEVRKRLCQSRGRELPGNFNSLIVGELFLQQARPWEDIVSQYTDYLLEDVRSAMFSMLKEVFDTFSAEGLLRHVLNRRLSELEDSLRAKITELLEPQKSGHPITYNPQYTKSIQETRDQHFRTSVIQKLKSFFGDDFRGGSRSPTSFVFCMEDLIDKIASRTESDMERFACSEAIDCMQAYYGVALNKFVDDFSNLAVEKCLLMPLGQVLSPAIMDGLPNDTVNEIAREDENTIMERERLVNRLSILNRCLRRLQHLDKYNLTGSRASHKEALLGGQDDNLMANGDGIPDQVGDDDASSIKSVSVNAGDTYEMQPRSSDDWGVPNVVKKNKKHRKAALFE